VYISDEDKRQIMKELAQGNIHLLPEATAFLSGSDQNLDLQDYQNFDDFAQRPAWQGLKQDTVVQAFFSQLKQRGLSNSTLEE
jgi:hypothetical protein